MRVFYHPLSPYCRKVLLALYEKAVPFEAEIVNLVDPDAREAFVREVNPLGRVPFVVTERGDRLQESTILIELLEERFPVPPRLLNVQPDAARAARLADRLGDQYLIDPAAVLLDEQSRPAATRDREAVQANAELVRRGLAWLDERLSMHRFCAGPAFTLGDLAPSVGLYDLQMAGWSFAAWPRVSRWLAEVLDRPAWQRVLAESEPFLTAWCDPARDLPLASTRRTDAARLCRDEPTTHAASDSLRPPLHLRIV